MTDPALEAAAQAAYHHAITTTRTFAASWAADAVQDVLGHTWDELDPRQRDHYRSVAHDVITAYHAAGQP